MRFLQWIGVGFGFLFGGCLLSTEELFSTAEGDTLPINSIVTCVYSTAGGPYEKRYQVERVVRGEKSQYRFKDGFLNRSFLVAFHKINDTTWISVASQTTTVGSTLSGYLYRFTRPNADGKFEIISHGASVLSRLAALHDVGFEKRGAETLVGDSANQKRFLMVLAAEPGDIAEICTSN